MGAAPLSGSLMFGIAVMIAIYVTRNISGAHLNPAFTFSFMIFLPEGTPPNIVLPYIAAQMIGATLAAGIMYLVFKNGMARLDTSQGFVRGDPDSCKTFNCAYGMVVDRSLLATQW